MKAKRIKLLLCATVIGLCFAVQARALPLAFGIATDNNLYSIDLGSGAATVIGSSGFLEGLAVSPTGDLYGTDTSGNLYNIDSSNGSATLIGSTGRGNIEGLDFNGNVLFGATFSSSPTIFSIDLTTASATDIVTATSAGAGVVRAMATLDANTMLLSMNDSNNGFLQSLDLTTGALSSIGFLTNESQSPLGLDFASDGNLYGAWSTGEIFEIDPSDASTTLVGDSGDQFWLAMAAQGVVRVPEPTSFLLLVLGLAGLRLMKRPCN